MNERLGESLSALMDNEADELEIERVLALIGEDGELRAAWRRYNLARDSLLGQRLSHTRWDISERVRTAVATSRAGRATANKDGAGQKILRPLTSLAVAASVAATVVIGGQHLAQVSGGDRREMPVLRVPLNPGIGNSPGISVRASYGMQPLPVLQPATRSAYNDLARQRWSRYMQEHAEQAALNSPQGLLPFARVPEIRE